MLMRKVSVLVVAFAALISAHIVSGQAWRDAVVVMTNRDSVRGQIEFTDPDVSVSSFRFRSDPGSPPVTYSIDDANSFLFVDPVQRFVKLEVQVTYYSRGVVPWGGNPITGIKKINAFAEVIRESPSIALFSVHDEDRKERFFVRKGNELIEL